MLEHLKSHLQGQVIVLGIGNTLRSDDAVGSILASRIKDKVPYTVWDAGVSPENYLEKIIGEKPDTVLLIDAADFGGKPGEYRVLESQDLKTANLFFTHNASVSLLINYLQSSFKVDIIILIIQPKFVGFGDTLSEEVARSSDELEEWFSRLTPSVSS